MIIDETSSFFLNNQNWETWFYWETFFFWNINLLEKTNNSYKGFYIPYIQETSDTSMISGSIMHITKQLQYHMDRGKY